MKPTGLALTAGLTLLVCSTALAQQTQNPHGKLQEECAVCHSPEAWVPARISSTFDHAKRGIALTGAHARAACRSCHASLDFRGAPDACLSCHGDVHRGELGNDCSRCHTPRSFLDRSIMVRAHQMTRFALSGTHLALDCEACHTPAPQGRLAFVSLPGQCVDCHRDQYQIAKNPDHVAGGFPQNCNQCHAPTIWAAARFNHDASGFPLTGAHRAIPCAQCHGTTFTNKSTACVSCHQQDYDGTTSPNHASAGFPTTCQDCHTTTGWTGAALNHTWFPIPHHGADACSDCHTNPPNYTVFVCTLCHTQAKTDPKHSGVRGYVWNSTNCYACHPNGRKP